MDVYGNVFLFHNDLHWKKKKQTNKQTNKRDETVII